MRVLIAEDNPVSAAYLREHFERQGWSVEITIDGESAIRCLERERYDAVLVDWLLPRYDGIEVVQAVRENSYQPQPYIAIMSVVDSQAVRRFCLTCGANNYFVKPINPSNVITDIQLYYTQMKSQ